MKLIFLSINLFILSICASASVTLPVPEKSDEALKIVSIDPFSCVYYQGKGLGLMNASGTRLTEDSYFSIYPLGEKLYKVQKSEHGLFALMSSTGKLITPYEYEDISTYTFRNAIVSKKFQDTIKYSILQTDGQIASDWVDKIYNNESENIWTFSENGQWGVIIDGEKNFFSHSFDQVGSFNMGLAPALQNGKWGYIDHQGEWGITPSYHQAQSFNGKYAAVKISSFQWQMIDRKGENQLPLTYDSIHIYQEGAYSIVYRNGKGSFLGFNTLPINHEWYSKISEFREDGIATCVLNGQFIYVNHLGEQIFEADSLLDFKYGKGIFQKNGKWGWTNEHGKILQEAVYDSILSYQEKSILVLQGEKIYLIQHEGNTTKEIQSPFPEDIVLTSEALLYPTQPSYYLVDLIKNSTLPLPYDEVGPIENGFILVKHKNLFGIIDKEGKEILPTKYYSINISNGLYLIIQENENSPTIAKNTQLVDQFTLAENIRFVGLYQENRARIMDSKGFMGFIDEKGKIVIPCKYPIVGDFHQNRAIFTNLQGKMGFLDESGEEIIPAIYKYVSNFDKSGFAAVIKDDKFGFIHTSGNVVIPFIYDKVLSLSNGIASVEQNGKVGYINMQNKKVIPFTFDEAYQTFDGLALVRMSIYWGYINPKGKAIIPWQYSEAQHFSEGKAWVKLDKRWGAIFTNGNFAIPLKYEQVLPFKNGFARISNNKKWGLIQENGKEIIPTICHQISEVYQHKTVVEVNTNGYGIIIIK